MLSPCLHRPRIENGTAAISCSPHWYVNWIDVVTYRCSKIDRVHSPIHNPTITYLRKTLRPKKCVLCIAVIFCSHLKTSVSVLLRQMSEKCRWNTSVQTGSLLVHISDVCAIEQELLLSLGWLWNKATMFVWNKSSSVYVLNTTGGKLSDQKSPPADLFLCVSTELSWATG